jgi:pimeloyl-ACP methyl ester carboxylesterase
MDIALVHGNFHGAWCWDLLRPELERLGHRVFTMDLPISDPTCGTAEYADAVDAALPADSVPVLVGHSAGGLTIPLVAARRPVRRLIFLAALLPMPGRTPNEQRSSEPVDGGFVPTTAQWTDLGGGLWAVGADTATELFFPDAPQALAEWATARFRPQWYGILDQPMPIERWPSVESRSIVCRDDRAVNPDWVRAVAHERLETEAVEIDGGHSPFLTRPVELADLIHSLI